MKDLKIVVALVTKEDCKTNDCFSMNHNSLAHLTSAVVDQRQGASALMRWWVQAW